MSIIDPKYAGKYRNDADWLTNLINDQCYVQKTKEVDDKDEEGNVVGKKTVNDGKPVLDLDALFDLAEANGIPAREKYGAQAEKKNAPGRLRMTIGNSLRAAAKKRHGLYNADRDWMDASADFIGDSELTQTREGEKIAKPKPVAEAAE